MGEYKGRVVLMWRGGCSFTDKVRRAQQAGTNPIPHPDPNPNPNQVRRAQQAGAAACIVVQTYVDKHARNARPAILRPKRRIGRGWPRLGAAPGSLWRW